MNPKYKGNNRWAAQAKRWIHRAEQQVEALLAVKQHHIILTGLSRSGKSMLCTSLMFALEQRQQTAGDGLPLLSCIPQHEVESVELTTHADFSTFPYEQNMRCLRSGSWPPPTTELSCFDLHITLKPRTLLNKALGFSEQIRIRFHDYPGEWLTDLPMLTQSFQQWSDSSVAQQMNPPQVSLAAHWHQYMQTFDFNEPPTAERVSQYVAMYRDYLQAAKHAGISLLQPGSLLLPNPQLDWLIHGFAPLPSAIASDVVHPWSVEFQCRYQVFCDQWLTPLKRNYFDRADKQVILVDLLSGLGHSQAHLRQLKETVSTLSQTFLYGAKRWYLPKQLMPQRITRVAFAVSKADAIPTSQHPALLALLQDITAPIRKRLEHQSIEFHHFLLSAMQTTNPGSNNDALRFLTAEGDVEEWAFQPLPSAINELAQGDNYPQIDAAVPPDVDARLLQARGLDRLLNYLLAPH